MNLLGQWNKDKTRCWQIGMDMDLFNASLGSAHAPRYRAEKWTNHGRGNFAAVYVGPWRDTMEEAQKDIPNER